jgi:hypothetical protein
MRRVLRAVLVPFLLALGCTALLTGAASAATGPAGPSNTTHAIGSAPAQAAPQFSGCGWRPANNSHKSASYNQSGVNIRSGADTSCTILGSGYPGQSVTVRCAWYNSGDGRWWDYLTDNSTGVTGWSADQYVNWSGSVLVC